MFQNQTCLLLWNTQVLKIRLTKMKVKSKLEIIFGTSQRKMEKKLWTKRKLEETSY